MKYLLDVNILVAWGWSDHLEHERTVSWIQRVQSQNSSLFVTSPIPQLGFVRVSVQRTGERLSVQDAAETLASMIKSLKERHVFLADDRSAAQFPSWCRSSARTTDAHLTLLAQAHGLRLATLDSDIPGAFVIPGGKAQSS